MAYVTRGLLIWAAVFAAAFAMGVVRTLVIAPLVPPETLEPLALIVETLVLATLAASLLVSGPRAPGAIAAVLLGLLWAVMTIAADGLLAVFAMNMTLDGFIATLHPARPFGFFWGLLVLALVPPSVYLVGGGRRTDLLFKR